MDEIAPVPSMVPGAFVVDLLEDTGRFDRGEAELLPTWFEWVEAESRGFPGVAGGALLASRGCDQSSGGGVGAPRCFGLLCDPVRGGDGTRVPSRLSSNHLYTTRANPGYPPPRGRFLSTFCRLILCREER